MLAYKVGTSPGRLFEEWPPEYLYELLDWFDEQQDEQE